MTLEEYQAWTAHNAPTVPTKSERQKYRENCRKAVEKAASRKGDVKNNIQNCYPFKKRDAARVLAFLQESHKKLRELGLFEYPEKL